MTSEAKPEPTVEGMDKQKLINRLWDTGRFSFVEVEAIADAAFECAERREDARLAATDLPVELPEPGTDAARLLLANRLLKAQLEEAKREIERLRELVPQVTGNEPWGGLSRG